MQAADNGAWSPTAFDDDAELVTAVRAAQVGSFIWDVGSDAVRWSAELCRIHGIDCSEFGGTYDAFIAFVHPADVPLVTHVIREALRHPGPFRYDHRIVRADGEARTIHSQGRVETDEAGRPARFIGACWDVTEPASARREMERSLSLLRATLDATANGILVVDRERHVVAYNEQFLRMWRVPPEIAQTRDDRTFLAFVHDQLRDPDAFSAKVRELYDRPDAESMDALSLKDGRTFERVSKPQRLRDEIVGRVWSFHDVTDREKAIAARELFLATAAHEYRGPLMSIRLAVQRLEEGAASPEESRTLLKIADREIGRLSRFVNQLLDVGRLRDESLELHLEDVDLVKVVEAVVTEMQDDVAQSGSVVSVRSDAKTMVRADAHRLKQVVANLLSNALRFGRHEPVEIVIGRVGGRVTLAITDHGIGMDEDATEHVFEPFERRVSTRQYGGLGLGLHIVQSLVAAMGGEIRVESALGHGSTFTVEVPAEAA